MSEVVIYSKVWCSYCVRAKRVLEAKGIPFHEIDITDDLETAAALIEQTGRRTVPQIFINGRAIGGCDDLMALDAAGELDTLLAGEVTG